MGLINLRLDLEKLYKHSGRKEKGYRLIITDYLNRMFNEVDDIISFDYSPKDREEWEKIRKLIKR